MRGYWIRQRLLPTVILSATIALIAGLLFLFPYISQRATDYNEQSIYKNTAADFIVPEPAFNQVQDLPGTNGIDKIFPFYMTKTSVTVNGKSKTTTVLLSDQFQNSDITMYNDTRLIEEAHTEYENPIIVDWQFYKDTSAGIGDIVSVTIDGTTTEYRVSAIYETNSVYDGGAILAQITVEQKDAIMQKSKNSGYSGMYVLASDYNACQAYLTSDYRPLGRLKDRNQFESDSQYQVHYDTIMNSGYSNEITDLRIRENSLTVNNSVLMVWLGAVLSAVFVVVFDLVMAKRGCENVYFRKHCIPKGQNVKKYYKTSFFAEIFLIILLYAGVLIWKISSSPMYIPKAAINANIAVVPAVVVIAGIVSLVINNSTIDAMAKAVKTESAAKRKNDELEDNVENGNGKSS